VKLMAVIERARKYNRTSWTRAYGITGTSFGKAGTIPIYEESGSIQESDTSLTFGTFTYNADPSALTLERASMSSRKGEKISYQKTIIGDVPLPTSGTGNACSEDLKVECDVYELNWNLSANPTFLCQTWRLGNVTGSSTITGTVAYHAETPSEDHWKHFPDKASITHSKVVEVGQQVDPDFGQLEFQTVEVMCVTGVPWANWKTA